MVTNKSLKTKIKKTISVITLLSVPAYCFAVKSLADTQQDITTQANAAIAICKIAIGVVLAISLVVIIYHISQGSHRAKDALIGWFVAVAMYGIGISVIG